MTVLLCSKQPISSLYLAAQGKLGRPHACGCLKVARRTSNCSFLSSPLSFSTVS
jgi:hypothetical protein